MTRQDFAREKAKQRKNEAMKMASKRHKQRAKAVVDTPDYIKEVWLRGREVEAQ